MQNNFGEKIKNLRNTKYPQLSLRKVGEEMATKHGFPKFFYTQLNKIELGFVLPSSELLAKLLDAYNADNKEREVVIREYIQQVAEEKLHMVAEDTKVDPVRLGQMVLNRKKKINK